MTGSSLGVAVIGYGWMGRLHAQAYLRLRHHYPQLPAARLIGVAEPEADRRDEAVSRFGFFASIADGKPHGATVEDAVASAQVLEAMTQSARTGRWIPVGAQ